MFAQKVPLADTCGQYRAILSACPGERGRSNPHRGRSRPVFKSSPQYRGTNSHELGPLDIWYFFGVPSRLKRQPGIRSQPLDWHGKANGAAGGWPRRRACQRAQATIPTTGKGPRARYTALQCSARPSPAGHNETGGESTLQRPKTAVTSAATASDQRVTCACLRRCHYTRRGTGHLLYQRLSNRTLSCLTVGRILSNTS